MRTLQIGTTAVELTTSPFLPGGSAVVTKPTATDATLQGSEDGTNYTTFATVPATGYLNVASLPRYLKVASGSPVFLLQN